MIRNNRFSITKKRPILKCEYKNKKKKTKIHPCESRDESDDEYFARLEAEIAKEEIECRVAKERLEELSIVRNFYTLKRGQGRPKKLNEAGSRAVEISQFPILMEVKNYPNCKNNIENNNTTGLLSYNNATEDQFPAMLEHVIEELEFDSESDDRHNTTRLLMDPIKLRRRAPYLHIPNSSSDLNCPNVYIMDLLSIYEPLRCYHRILQLSFMLFEDFVSAMVSTENSVILAEVHITLMKAILREDECINTHHATLDSKEAATLFFNSIDNMSWPYLLNLYLCSIKKVDLIAKNAANSMQQSIKMMNILNPSGSNQIGGADRYLSCNIFPEEAIPLDYQYPLVHISKRIIILKGLVSIFMSTGDIRAEIIRLAPLLHEEFCRVCHLNGELLGCDSCTAVFHIECLKPRLEEIPSAPWICPSCEKQAYVSLNDSAGPAIKSARKTPIGTDRAGRIYWHISRRIFVEPVDFSQREPYLCPHINGLKDDWEKEAFQASQDRRKSINLSINDHKKESQQLSDNSSFCSSDSNDSNKSRCYRFYRNQCNPTLTYNNQLDVYYYSTYDEIENLRSSLSLCWEPYLCHRLDDLMSITLPKEMKMTANILNTGLLEFQGQFQSANLPLNLFCWPVLECNKIHGNFKHLCRKEEILIFFDIPIMNYEMNSESIRVNELNKARILYDDDSSQLEDLSNEIIFLQNYNQRSINKIQCIESTRFSLKCSIVIKDFQNIVLNIDDLKFMYKNTDVPPENSQFVKFLTKNKHFECSKYYIAYRYGDEGLWKRWVNHFSNEYGIFYPPLQKDDARVNIALCRNRHLEERERCKYLQNKFSLVDPFTIRNWSWLLNSYIRNYQTHITGIKLTLMLIEQYLPNSLLSPVWVSKRDDWYNDLSNSFSSENLTRALLVLNSVIKPICNHRAWFNMMGNLSLERNTSAMREEDKRFRNNHRSIQNVIGFISNRNIEIFRLSEESKSQTNFLTKNIKLIKHNIWKIKGEEYRKHGGNGWSWIARIPKWSDQVPSNKFLLKPDSPHSCNSGVLHGVGWSEMSEYLIAEKAVALPKPSYCRGHILHPITGIPLYLVKSRIKYTIPRQCIYIPEDQTTPYADRKNQILFEKKRHDSLNISRGLRLNAHFTRWNKICIQRDELCLTKRAQARRLEFNSDNMLDHVFQIAIIHNIIADFYNLSSAKLYPEKYLQMNYKNTVLEYIAKKSIRANQKNTQSSYLNEFLDVPSYFHNSSKTKQISSEQTSKYNFENNLITKSYSHKTTGKIENVIELERLSKTDDFNKIDEFNAFSSNLYNKCHKSNSNLRSKRNFFSFEEICLVGLFVQLSTKDVIFEKEFIYRQVRKLKKLKTHKSPVTSMKFQKENLWYSHEYLRDNSLLICPTKLPQLNSYQYNFHFSPFKWQYQNLRPLISAAGRQELSHYDVDKKRSYQCFWPYPSARPCLGESWRFNLTRYIYEKFASTNLSKLSCLSLHLRIYWSSISWLELDVNPNAIHSKSLKLEDNYNLMVNEKGYVEYRREMEHENAFMIRKILKIKPLDKYWLKANFFIQELKYNQVTDHLNILKIAESVKAFRGVDDHLINTFRQSVMVPDKTATFNDYYAKKRGRPKKIETEKYKYAAKEQTYSDSDDADWEPPSMYMTNLLGSKFRKTSRELPLDTTEVIKRISAFKFDRDLNNYIRNNPLNYLSELNIDLAAELQKNNEKHKGNFLLNSYKHWLSEKDLNLWEIQSFIETLFPFSRLSFKKNLPINIKYASSNYMKNETVSFCGGAFGTQIKSFNDLKNTVYKPIKLPVLTSERIDTMRELENKFIFLFISLKQIPLNKNASSETDCYSHFSTSKNISKKKFSDDFQQIDIRADEQIVQRKNIVKKNTSQLASFQNIKKRIVNDIRCVQLANSAQKQAFVRLCLVVALKERVERRNIKAICLNNQPKIWKSNTKSKIRDLSLIGKRVISDITPFTTPMRDEDESSKSILDIIKTQKNIGNEFYKNEFLICCSLCQNWFNFVCLFQSIDADKSISNEHFQCENCISQLLNKNAQKACVCFDNLNIEQLSIACENCVKWYHNGCIALTVLQISALKDIYTCTFCRHGLSNDTNNMQHESKQVNRMGSIVQLLSMSDKLTRLQISKFLQSITEHRMSWPFIYPYDERKYSARTLKNILNPMDLATIKDKFESNLYSNLREIDRDLNLIFQASNLIHAYNSLEYHCAIILENFIKCSICSLN